MFSRVTRWYNEWEQEQLDVLADPSVALRTEPGYRRYFANKLAELSPIERQQLRAFSIKYRGRTFWIAIAKFVLAFSILGAILHLLRPEKFGVLHSLFLGNAAGFGLLIAFLGVWFNSRKIAANKVKLVLTMVVAATIGAVAGSTAAMIENGKPLEVILERLPLIALRVGLISGAAMAVPLLLLTWIRVRHSELLSQQLRDEAERERLAREVSESKLRLLRAQIEPHFLFNTLGAVQQLAEQGAPRAAELTANLIEFLRASMMEMRMEQVSLSSEFGLVEAYLKVMKARLGDRLHFTVSLPAALDTVGVPSMVLLTLVENAIKHGIEPSLRGGEIAVSAHQDGQEIWIRVEDTGVGMGDQQGAGEGLENVRRRLQLALGDAAVLQVRDGDAHGVVADIRLPVSMPAGSMA